jgi:GT2 family glycosyltransferase
MTNPGGVRVSVLVAAYDSHATFEGLLAALDRQTYRDFETIVVDSGPSNASAAIAARFPHVRYVRSERRLLPQEARSVGLEVAAGSVLVFSDADVYPRPDWLERSVAAHDETGGAPIVGALACHGRLALDLGIHFCKFSKWLPAGERRPVDMGPTASLLLARSTYDACRGLDEDPWLGDVTLSWNLLERGETLWLEPRAVVEHHHVTGFADFLRERRSRGAMYSRLAARRGRLPGGPGATNLGRWLATALGPRLLSNLMHSWRHARAAGLTGDWFATLPVQVAGWAATLRGEAQGLELQLSGLGSAFSKRVNAAAESPEPKVKPSA